MNPGTQESWPKGYRVKFGAHKGKHPAGMSTSRIRIRSIFCPTGTTIQVMSIEEHGWYGHQLSYHWELPQEYVGSKTLTWCCNQTWTEGQKLICEKSLGGLDGRKWDILNENARFTDLGSESVAPVGCWIGEIRQNLPQLQIEKQVLAGIRKSRKLSWFRNLSKPWVSTMKTENLYIPTTPHNMHRLLLIIISSG